MKYIFGIFRACGAHFTQLKDTPQRFIKPREQPMILFEGQNRTFPISARRVGLGVLTVSLLCGLGCSSKPAPRAVREFNPADAQFIDEVCQTSFDFFWNEAHPETGLIPDRMGISESSVAAVGFGLAALPIGVERGYVDREPARQRALTTLQTLDRTRAKRYGLYAHFIDMATGQPSTTGYETAISSIDTALMIAGAIVAGEYFGGEVKELADRLYAEIDWNAFVNPENECVYMAWRTADPTTFEKEGKFGWATWNFYTDETLLIALLGIASPNEEHRLPVSAYHAWPRVRDRYKEGPEFIISRPGTLFTYTFAHCFYDFRAAGKDPDGVDWFANTTRAIEGNRDWCRDNAHRFATYGHDRWGVTAGSAPGHRYIIACPVPRIRPGEKPEGGTLHPYGAGMSLPFLPDDTLAALRHMRELKVDGKPVWQEPYGFMDGFNIDEKWVSDEIIGVAHGPMLVLMDNARDGLVWDLFMNHPAIRDGLQRTGFGRQ